MNFKYIYISIILAFTGYTSVAQCEATGHSANSFADATNNNTITTELNWNAVPTGDEYQVAVFYNEAQTIGPITTDTTSVFENLLPNATYNWRVRVKCAGVWSSWPTWQSTFDTPNGASCEASGHLVNSFADAANNNTITSELSWNSNPVIEEYQVSLFNNGAQTLGSITTDTTMVFQNLLPNVNYQWRIRVKCNGEWSTWPTWQSTFNTPDGTSCEASGHQVSSYVDSSNGNTITSELSWNSNPVIEEYQVSLFNNGTQTVGSITTDTSMVFQNLLPNTTYQWRVRVKCNGEWSTLPNWQSTFDTPDGASCEATGLQAYAFADENNNHTITSELRWDANPLIEEYQVSVFGNNTQTLGTITTDTVSVLENLLPNTTYQWRVRVKCNGEWSTWPNWQSTFITPDGASCLATGHEATSFIDVPSNSIQSVLRWDSNPLIEEYQVSIFHNSTQILGPITSDTVTVFKDLLPDSEYQWRILVKCNGVWVINSSWQSSFNTSNNFSGYPIQWDTLEQVTLVSENELNKTGVDGQWDAGASSLNSLDAGEDGWIEVTIDDLGDSYMFGLSAYDEDVDYRTIDHAIQFGLGGNGYIYEDAHNKLSFGAIGIGDVLRISREGDSIRYYHNGSVLRSVYSLPTEPLIIDLSIAKQGLPAIVSSFETKLKVTPTFDYPEAPTASGSISLNVEGGDGNYTYAWSSGETGNNISQPVGSYTVDVSDGSGLTHSETFYLGYSIQWDTLEQVTLVSENELNKTGVDGQWDSGSASLNRLDSAENGWIEMTIDDLGDSFIFGLSAYDEDVDYRTIDHAILFGLGGNGYVYEDAHNKLSFGAIGIGDVLRISREGDSVRYYHNGSVLRSVYSLPTEPLIIDLSIAKQGLPAIVSSFETKLKVTPTFDYPETPTASGSISLNVEGGDGNYTYAWSSGETGNNISQPVGSYTVDVSDGSGLTHSETFYLGYSIQWDTLEQVTLVSENELNKTGVDGQWDSGSASLNRLDSAENGWIEMTIDDLGDSFIFGLSAYDEDVDYRTIDHAIQFGLGNGYIYEDAHNKLSFGAIGIGDVLRISREGDSVRYYHNGSVLRSVYSLPTEPLIIDLSIAKQGLPAIVSSFETKLKVTPTFDYPEAPTASGSISLNVEGGDGNYTYAWSSGETGNNISQPVGSYTVDVSDGSGLTHSETFYLGYSIQWDTLGQVTLVSENELNKTGVDGQWDSGAASLNSIDASEDGWIEVTIDDLGDSFMFGLSAYDEDVDYRTIDHAIQFGLGNGYIYEDAYNKLSFGPIGIGDVLRISREGDSIRYYHNSLELRSVYNSAAEPLIIDLSIAKQGVPGIISSFAQEPTSQPFITTWKTDNPGTSSTNQITIPTHGTGYNYTINWVDMANSNVTGTAGPFTETATITFPSSGTYQVSVSGDFPKIYFNNEGDKDKILSVDQWGSTSWSSMERAFYGCSNLTIVAQDVPDLSNVSNASHMFQNASSLNQDINDWDVSNITDMRYMFAWASSFDQPLGDWNVSNVTHMGGMFLNTIFNQNIGEWDVGNVAYMFLMFKNATFFNQDIGGWNVNNVTDMSSMFYGASDFNQDLSSWNTSKVADMKYMFRDAVHFNSDLGNWDVSQVTNMQAMFFGSNQFNQDISSWNVSSVTNMQSMFFGPGQFNQDISSWDVSSVTNMANMFQNNSSFNQPIGSWDVSKVENMSAMFSNATSFNQDLSNWNVSSVEGMSWMFSNATIFNSDIGNWDVSSVLSMNGMFLGTSFNQDISSWDVSSVTNMANMFQDNSSFNQPIGSWDVSSVTNMFYMFRKAHSFNADVSSWDVSSVTNMSYIFSEANAFDQNLGSWDISNVTILTSALVYTNLSLDNYNNTLIGWSSLPSLQHNLTFGAHGLSYCSESARAVLTDTYGWTISGDILTTGCTLPPVHQDTQEHLAVYNGNVSAMRWRGVNDSEEQLFTYSYDGLNRLTQAQYAARNSSGYQLNKGLYSVPDIQYDLNGNIKSLTRQGINESNAADVIDALTYDYHQGAAGNQLMGVSDIQGSSGFKDGSQSGDDYVYDANGNMERDRNKGIEKIHYNHLNLPRKVEFETLGDSIIYLYDAAGIKLQQRVYKDGSLEKTTDYVGEFIYEDGEIQLIQHEEGRLVVKPFVDIILSKDGNNTTGYTPNQNVTITSVSSEIKVVTNQSSNTPGVWPIDGSHTAEEGEQYRLSVTGYSDVGTEAHLFARVNNTSNVVWKGERLPEGPGNKSTVSNTFTIPAGGTSLQVGVLFSDNPTAGQAFYISNVELVKLSNDRTYDYQYHLKDHLGNVRVTFSTTPENYTVVQDMESLNDAGTEPAIPTHFVSIPYRTDATVSTSENEVATLDAGETGVMIFISVQKRDTLNFSVQANYTDNQSSYGLASILANTVLGSYNTGAPADQVLDASAGTPIQTGLDQMVNAAGLNKDNSSSDAPRAYLNYIYFNEDMTYNRAGYVQVSTAAQGLNKHELLELDMGPAEVNGYVLAYLTNETMDAIPVNFDDFTIYHGKSDIVSTQDYYPFGLTFNESVRVASTEQRFTYSGKEEQDDWGVGVIDFEARFYDAAIGRFIMVDPMADERNWVTQYNYVQNNPMLRVDPTGMLDWVEDADGNIYWDDNATSQETTKAGEKYLGKNVLVATHNRDADGNEEVNSATFELYLESDKDKPIDGPTATLDGNTVPSDIDQFGTLAEGVYPARFQPRASKPDENALIINEGGELPTVNGNPNKENSDNLTEVFFHRGNPYQESLSDSQGQPVWSHGCLTGGCGSGSEAKFNTFMGNAQNFNGVVYLRGQPKKDFSLKSIMPK